MSELFLPVSIGEGLDKLTILDIKLNKIEGVRRGEIEKEYDILHVKLRDYVLKYEFYYNMLKNTNLDIWNMLDDIKLNKHDNENKLKLYEIMWDKNDIRFKIKDRINDLSESNLKEKKGYVKTSVLINLPHDILLDYFINPLKYYTFLYDKVYVNMNINIDLEFPIEFIKDHTNINVDKVITFSKSQYTQGEIYEMFEITHSTRNVYKGLIF